MIRSGGLLDFVYENINAEVVEVGNGLDKKRFLLYLSSKKLIDMLSDEQAGVLLKSIFRYVDGEDLPEMDGMTGIVFTTIKEYLDRDQKAYEEKCRINRKNGGKGGRPRKKPNETQKNRTVSGKNRTKPNKTQRNPEKPDIDLDTDSDTESDIDKDIDIDRDRDIDNKRFHPPSLDEVRRYCQERNNNINPERFLDYYNSHDWKVGDRKITDWKMKIRDWETYDKNQSSDRNQSPVPENIVSMEEKRRQEEAERRRKQYGYRDI